MLYMQKLRAIVFCSLHETAALQIVDEEQRARHGQREELAASERRGAVLAGELDELRSQIDVAEKTRKMTETELREISERVADLTNANAALMAAKKKTEVELQTLHVSIYDRRPTGQRRSSGSGLL